MTSLDLFGGAIAPKPPSSITLTNYTLASGFIERVESQLREIENGLQPDETAQMVIVLTNGALIYPELFGCNDPDIVIVNGVDSAQRRVALLLHRNTLQILVTVVKQEAAKIKQKIGFPVKMEVPHLELQEKTPNQ